MSYGLFGLSGTSEFERRLDPVDVVERRPFRRACGIILRQEVEQAAHLQKTFHVVVVGAVSNGRFGGVHRRAAQFLGCDDLVGHRLHHVRAGDEHVARVAHHEDEIGHRRRIDVAAGARAHNYRINSNYNSLQVAVNKRFTKGLAFLAAYTWSRYYDYNSTADNQDGFVQPGINPFNLNDMYGPSDNDAPQRFVLSYDYTLPFYHFVHRVRPLTDGWRLVGITTFQTGFPVRIANSNAPSDTCWSGKENIDVICWDRPNTTGTPLAIGNPRTYTIGGLPNYYFNPAAFAAAAPGTGTGTASRNMFHGPGINNFDLTLMKDVHFTESKYVELRFETYNLFNHTQFSPFSYQPTNDIGGVVADIADPRFGEVIAASSPRVIQIAGKIYF